MTTSLLLPLPNLTDDLTRRELIQGGMAAGLLVAAGCGPGDGNASNDRAVPEAPAPGFPRVIEHKFGSTTLASPPARVVALTDGAELASLLALGVVPVGFGQRNDPLRPWIVKAGGDAASIQRFKVIAKQLPLETIAQLGPDVIVGQEGFMADGEYDKLTPIAATVATPPGPWPRNLRLVARVVGREEEAERLVTETEAGIADARGRLALPGGLRVDFVSITPDGMIGRFFAGTPIVGLAGQVGAKVLPDAADGKTNAFISAEQLGQVDGDAVVVFEFGHGSLERIEANPLWAKLPAVAAGRVVPLTSDESNAGFFDSVLTVPLNLVTTKRIIDAVRR